MITAEIRVNCGLIGHIYCVNEVQTEPPGEWYAYSYEYYMPGEQVIKGTVKHYRPNGAIALLKEICEDIETKGGK